MAESAETSALRRNSKDVAWEYGMLCNPKNPDKVKCKLCGKEFSGGAYRMKEHIAKIQGNVSACPLSSKEDQEKCKTAIDEAKKKRKNKMMSDVDLRNSVKICDDGEEDVELGEMGTKKKPRTLGPMDKFASDINPRLSSIPTKQQNISDALWKDRLHKVHQYVARWVYVAGVSFNSTGIDEFKLMLEAAGQFGPGVTPPSQYLLREPLLKEEVGRVKGLLKTQEEEWKENGCSGMTDAWSDRKRRSIMNLCINCRGGTMFRSSRECSEDAHTGQFIFEFVKGCIEDVGVENVVQVVTDNAPNNMAAAKILKEKLPSIFWTSCAAHTVNLMLESIGKLHNFKTVIDRAKGFTIFVYAHHKTLAMMRKFTQNKDIVRPRVTRFASCFLTLQSLMDKQDKLEAMFISTDWKRCKWAKHPKGVEAYKTVRIDGDKKPTMGYLHGELTQAKVEVRGGLNNVEKNIQPIMNIIDQRIKGRHDNPLHLSAYFLNPYYFYKDSTIPLKDNCNVINAEITKYKKKEDNFGTLWAIKGCEDNKDDYDPVEWWSTYGTSVPNLQRMAKRILSLTTSSSGCERSWSSFEGIHTKKRNRLDTSRLNNLVFVQFNTRIMNKRKKVQKEKNIDILVADHAIYAQEWIIEGENGEEDLDVDLGLGSGERAGKRAGEGARETSMAGNVGDVRELDDEVVISDDEDEEHVDIDFESDGDEVQDIYGV
ncbi:PREDICTED: uncharacterized protein LOC104705021 [Camelina sativa]|uniref:Uncharacterized protein LOC104705021 n=1 Tax=Camelina sativa TaxID=90675 RepID=A0ABM0T178_CAMSA|nr:PREDICTED: uncharacterized protein LOC104705021 [Camelina sativa]